MLTPAFASRPRSPTLVALVIPLSADARGYSARDQTSGGVSGWSMKSLTASALHVTERHGFAQRGERIAHRDELVGEVARKPVSAIAVADGPPVQLLGVVQLVAARDAAGVEMRDVVACCRWMVRITSPSMICMW